MFEFMTAPLQPLCALEHAAGISNLGHLGEKSCALAHRAGHTARCSPPSPAGNPLRTATDRSHPDQWRRYEPVLSSAESHNAKSLPWLAQYYPPLRPDSVNRNAPHAVRDSQLDRFPLGSNRYAQTYSPPPWQSGA